MTSWHKGKPDTDKTKEYLVKDPTGIITTRLYHPDKGWGEICRRPHKEVAEWMEIPK